MNQIPERLAAVRRRIRDAAVANGRDPDAIALLAVSKTKPVEAVRAAYDAGQRRFGENYLQDALAKIAALADADIEWHFIGRIQGNKTAEISRHFAWVHSLANQRHAELLDRHRPQTLPPLQVCLQVNLSGEASKGGIDATDLDGLAAVVQRLPRLRLRGLMTMPDPHATAERQRADFARLRELLAGLQAAGVDADTLSMGMSGDLEHAIAEGSTLVRIGTDIFGPRD
jgi:pyridoxal phosphate enzyme (YggS family)